MLIFSGCVNPCRHVHTLTCQCTSPFSPAGRLTSCHHGARSLEACRSLQHHANSTHRNRSLVLHLGSGNTMPSLVAKQESLLLQIHTGASVIHASSGLRSGELTSLDSHRHSTEQRNIHGQECSAAFRESEEENGWRHWTFVYCLSSPGSARACSLCLMRLENVQALWRKQTFEHSKSMCSYCMKQCFWVERQKSHCSASLSWAHLDMDEVWCTRTTRVNSRLAPRF